MRLRQAWVVWGLVIACAGSIVQAQAARLTDGTAVHVRLTADLLSSQAAVGARVDLEVSQPVMLHGAVAIPAGTTAWGGVQEVKKGKVLRFDIEGLRLPNLEVVKLRCSTLKTAKVVKDELKVETQVNGDLGAPKGSEFTAYLDQDVNVELTEAPATPAPVATPAPAPAPTPAPKPVAVPATPAPAPQTVPAPAAAPVTPAAPAAQPGEYITVEFFSDPLGADILIDDEFHGSTPSILKIVPGSHRVEFRLMGYKARSQPLNLPPGSPLRTVRMPLEKQP
jgi:hypothetical protein